MRKRDLSAGDPYYRQWVEYQRVRRRSIILFLLLFYGGGGLSVVLVQTLLPRAPLWAGPASVLPWAVAAIVVSQAAVRVPCPRCGKPFHVTFWYHNAFARRCVHCRLPKWAPGPGAGTPPGAAA